MRARAPDYGIDAPGLVRGFAAGGAVAAALAVTAARAAGGHGWGGGVATVLGLAATYAFGMAGLMLFWSKVTKVRERETLLDRIAWRGDEAVLDVGCGRGLLLVAAARRVPLGRATGIDIWQAADQSANTPAAARANAALEGVAARVDVRTADMRDLPFADGAFDVVVSHWAVHNLPDAADRDRALAEMARVLRSGGAVVLADIEHREAYAARLAALGLADQTLIAPPTRDRILGAVSFGSFRPFTIVARGSGSR